MTAAERKPDEKHLYREEKYASIYEINMLLVFFAVYVKMHVQRRHLLTTSKNCSIQLWKKILLWKDRLVMPLDIAMQNAQLKTPTNVDYTNYFFVAVCT
jgi:NADH-quinone oxidoreductase subunit I